MPLTLAPDEFKQAFPEESEHTEFKSGISRKQLQETAVAFSNADGGVILVGVADDGEILGRSLDGGTADAIHQVMRDVRDPGRYSIHEVAVGNRPITVISIARRQEGFAQTSSGIVRTRKGTRDEPLFGSDLQRFINARSATRYELTPTPLAIDASESELLEQLAQAFGWGRDSWPERLVEHGFAHDGHLTVAGALHLLRNPSEVLGKAHVELLRFRSDESVDYDLRLEIEGSLPDQLELAADRVLDELGTELVVLGIRRYDLPRVPPVVIREAIANALAHRSYEDNRTPVRIEIRPSSVIVLSPGGLPEPVTVENIRETTAPRNLSTIKALRHLGLAEDAGRGIDVMQDTMLQEMLDPPRFEDRGHEVVVTLPIRSAVAPVERAWIRELERRGALEGPDRLALVHAARGETLTNAKVRRILQTDEGTAREVLQRLRDTGFLEQRGERGGASYHLEGSLQPPAGLRLGPDELANLIENLAAEGPISNADVRQATGLERVEAREMLGRLAEQGRLTKTGERRGTRYSLPAP
ncbi:MAG TPA: RNA-binding domain-containing protein [Solirubrobacterales bacterium]|nr:RNA-binding domain-containing protein [Solirubrobacterales bacterium]